MSKQSRRRGGAGSRRTKPVREPQVVRALDPADLLRFVPELVSVDTADSMVVVLFTHSSGTRSRSIGAMRVDLPHDGDPELLATWSTGVLGQALQVEGITGIAAVAYTPATFAPSGRPPAAAQVRALCAAAERMGLEVLDRFCVAADGWGSLSDPELPRGGRPLAEIEPPAGAPRRPRTAAPVIPAPEAQRIRFTTHLAMWWGRQEGTGGDLHGVRLARQGASFGLAGEDPPAMERYRWGEDVEQVVDLIEGMLEPHAADDADGPCPCRALLYALASRQGIENLVLLQVAWGRDLAMEMWTAVNAPEGRERSLERLSDALGGRGFRRPDVGRIERGIEVLQEVSSYVEPERLRAPVDGMLSWLLWARGGSSLAADHALRALRFGPRDVPSVVLGMVQRNRLPDWAFRKTPGRDPFRALLDQPTGDPVTG